MLFRSAHPTDSYGYYLRDLAHHALYGEMSKTEEGYQKYVDEWIMATGNHAGFVAKLGRERAAELSVRKGGW